MNALSPAALPPFARTYRYDAIDKEMLADRTAEFRGQVARRLAGELTEDQFKPLRLMNGLYLQLHAYMLRIAIPYGVLNRDAAAPAGRDRPHATTRATATSPPARTSSSTGSSWRTRRRSWTSWPRWTCTPSRPAATASATSPPTPTPAPRPTRSRTRASGAEVIRQWSTLHPEFTFLPRKFKIAVTGRRQRPRGGAGPRHRPDARSASRDGALGFEVIVGGGLGRTPLHRPHASASCLPADRAARATWRRSCASTTAHGRRDNIYKARIKILVADLGAESSPARSRPNGRHDRRRESTCRTPSWPASAPPSRPPAFEALPATRRLRGRAQAGNAGLRPLRPQQRAGPQAARLRHRRTSR